MDRDVTDRTAATADDRANPSVIDST